MSDEPMPQCLPLLLIPLERRPSPEPDAWAPQIRRVDGISIPMTTEHLARLVAFLPESYRASFIAELRKHAAELKPLGWSFDEELCQDLDYTRKELAATRRVLTEEASKFQREADRERATAKAWEKRYEAVALEAAELRHQAPRTPFQKMSATCAVAGCPYHLGHSGAHAAVHQQEPHGPPPVRCHCVHWKMVGFPASAYWPECTDEQCEEKEYHVHGHHPKCDEYVPPPQGRGR
jgi:hypothetical protein